MYGIIDIGSNTIRLNVYKVDGDQFRLLFKNKISAGLVNYIVNGRMSMEGIQKASSVLYEFKQIVDNLEIRDLLIFATASLRNITNATEARLIIEKLTGLTIEVISGEEEGELGYHGAMFDVDLKDGVAVDIGGGSTEMVRFVDGDVTKSLSMPMGSLNMFLQHVEGILPKKSEMKDVKKSATELLDNHPISNPVNPILCGVGGTMRSGLQLYNYLYNRPATNKTLPAPAIEEMIKKLSKDYTLAREVILKVCPERVHTILPGLGVVSAVCEKLGAQQIVVSNLGVREGYLVSRVIQRGSHGN